MPEENAVQQPLTAKQKKWADEYILCMNKTEAARRAGYKGNDRTLASIGAQNYRKINIRTYIDERMKDIGEVTNTNQATLIRDLRNIVKVAYEQEKPDLAAANSAIDKITKILGHYAPEKKEHSGLDGAPLFPQVFYPETKDE